MTDSSRRSATNPRAPVCTEDDAMVVKTIDAMVG